MKEYQSELTKANRRAAENRIREDVIVKCKHCKRLMEFINDDINGSRYVCHTYYCLREVTFDNRITQL